MFRFSNQSIVPSKFVFGVGNFGVLYDVVPTTGENGASVLLNDGGVNGDFVRLRINSIDPTITSLFVYEDGGFESQGYGNWTYYDSKNGAENPTLNTVTINQFSEGSSLDIIDNLTSITSSIVLSYSAQGSNFAITDKLEGVTTTMGIDNGIPASNLGIVSTLSSITSSVSVGNTVPEYQVDIISSLSSVQTLMGLSNSDPSRSISIVSNLSPVTTEVNINNVIPEITFSIVDSLSSVSTIMYVVNGELKVHVDPHNLIYVKTKSRFINVR